MHTHTLLNVTWSPNLAYAIGLIASDGNLSNDQRHICFTSKDLDLVKCFLNCINKTTTISKKRSGSNKHRYCYVAQFSDVLLYRQLEHIGLTPCKSKTIHTLNIPRKYFRDFLRGCIDGDGNIDVSKHPQSNYPQLKTRIASGSINFLTWLQGEIHSHLHISGGWISNYSGVHVLCFAKNDSIELLRFIYYSETVPHLERKYKQAQPFLQGYAGVA